MRDTGMIAAKPRYKRAKDTEGTIWGKRMGEVFEVALNEGNVPEKLTRRYHHASIDRNQYQWQDEECKELTIGVG
jgi:hypothetical protein